MVKLKVKNEKCKVVESLRDKSSSVGGRKQFYRFTLYTLNFTLFFAAALSGFAKTFDVDISTGRPAASNEAYYHGETIEFRAVRGRSVVTNVEYSCVYYQTNGMDSVWWHTDGLVFHPTNDVGAASYRFFLEGRDDLGRDWHANGLLRLLPSPGFTPNTIELPVARLDFAAVDVLNPPWTDPDYSTNNTALVETIEATAPAPGNYATVSNKAMTALQEHQSLADYYNKMETQDAIKSHIIQPSEDIADNSDAVSLALLYNFGFLVEESDPTVPEWAKSQTQPLPPNYTTVSNKAMTALQSFTETDPTVSSWAKAATKPSYSWNEIGSKPTFATVATSGSYNDLSNKPTIPTVPTDVSAFNNDAGYLTDESDPSVKAWAKAATKPTYTAAEVGATTAEDVYRIVAGTNVILIVTNYNSATHAPAMKLQHLDQQSGQYVTYWDETRRHGMTLTNAMDYTDAAIETRAAPRAWSGTTSGLGSEAPAGVTWISTPETVIAGGYEYEKVVTTAGAVWVLSSNGLTTGATTNSFFRVSASDGTELFSIEKTDSYLIGVNADGITKSGNTATLPVNVVANAHPYIRATTNLVDAVWVKEDENGFTCPWATVSWSGTTGAYVATVTCSQPQAFFYFEYMVEGVAKIKNSAKTEMTGGILFNGTTYMPTVHGNKLEFVAQ